MLSILLHSDDVEWSILNAYLIKMNRTLYIYSISKAHFDIHSQSNVNNISDNASLSQFNNGLTIVKIINI